MVDTDTIFNGSQNRWTDSYNSFSVRSIQTENLIVDPVSQTVEFILQIAVRLRDPDELERCIVLVGYISQDNSPNQPLGVAAPNEGLAR